MSYHRARITTLQALVVGTAVGTHADAPKIREEFEDVHRAKAISSAGRRRLLQVLHSTRALDSTLKTFIAVNGYPGQPPTSLGGCLKTLAGPHPVLASLTPNERIYYRTMIADPRNIYMHQAGAFPADDKEVSRLLGNMQHCLTRLIRL